MFSLVSKLLSSAFFIGHSIEDSIGLLADENVQWHASENGDWRIPIKLYQVSFSSPCYLRLLSTIKQRPLDLPRFRHICVNLNYSDSWLLAHYRTQEKYSPQNNRTWSWNGDINGWHSKGAYWTIFSLLSLGIHKTTIPDKAFACIS